MRKVLVIIAYILLLSSCSPNTTETYQVSFNSIGGTLIESQNVKEGEVALEPEMPIKDNNLFVYWHSVDEEEEFDFETLISSDIELVALWDEILVFTIDFDSMGGTIVTSQNVTEGDVSIEPEIPIKDNNIFLYWYLEDEEEAFDFCTEISEDTELKALWDEILTFTVDFDSIGGTIVSSEIVTEGEIILEPSIPTKEGYTLEGWYTSLNDGLTLDEKWSFTTSNVRNDFTLYAKWEINSYDIEYYSVEWDQLGNLQLYFDETITSISLGKDHTSALTSIGRLYTWGYGRYGQLGDGTNTIIKSIKTEITPLFNLAIDETIEKVSFGEYHSSALSSDGRLFTWGLGTSGQLANGLTTPQNTPTDITSQFNLDVDETFISVFLGKSQSSALTSMGRLFTWGYNGFGQLGDGTTITTYTDKPVEITNQFNLYDDETITSVSLGEYHSSALTSKGRLFTWGYNEHGQLGDGTTTNKNTPTEITSRFDLNDGEMIIDISLGYSHSSALTSIGRLFSWGYNMYGQVGSGCTLDQTIPTEITSRFNLLENEIILDVSLGGQHSSALTSENNIFTWGNNDEGQTGDELISYKDSPTQITSKFNLDSNEKIISIELGYKFSGVLTSEGRFITWGYDFYSQLGGGNRRIKSNPVEITHAHAVLNTLQTDSYEYGSVITEYIPALEGYTFGGWYTDRYLTLLYLPTTMPSNNITLYCKWIPNE